MKGSLLTIYKRVGNRDTRTKMNEHEASDNVGFQNGYIEGEKGVCELKPKEEIGGEGIFFF